MKALQGVRKQYAAHVERSFQRLPGAAHRSPLPVACANLFELFVRQLGRFCRRPDYACATVTLTWRHDWGGLPEEAWRWVSAGLLNSTSSDDDGVSLPSPLLLGFMVDQLALEPAPPPAPPAPPSAVAGLDADQAQDELAVQRAKQQQLEWQQRRGADRAAIQRALARVSEHLALPRDQRTSTVALTVKASFGWPVERGDEREPGQGVACVVS